MMKMTMKQIYWIRTLVLFFLISGCAGPISTMSQAPSTPTAISVPTTKLPIDTPRSTLSAEETKILVFNLLKDNGDCQLPCLWGLTPGKTNDQTLDDFMAQFRDWVTPDVYVSTQDFGDVGGFFLGYRKDNVHINIDFSHYKHQDGKLEMLVLSGRAMQENGKDLDWLSPDVSPLYGDASFNQTFTYYLLPQILSNYGRPSQVWLKPFLEDPQRPDIQWQPFSLVLLYPEKGIFVEYVSPREMEGDNYIGCPSKALVNLAVWDPQSSLSLADIVQKAGSQINELNIDSFKPLEKVTSMTLNEFYDAFKNAQNAACLETPQSLWRP